MRRLVLAICCAAALIPVGARAQTDQSRPDVEVRFSSFTPWADSTRPLNIVLDVKNRSTSVIEDPSVRLTIYHRVFTRSELHRSLDGHPTQSVIAVSTEPLTAPLQPTTTTRVAIQRDLSKLTGVFGKSRKGSGGVYPVQIEMVGADRTLATQWTALVFFSTPPTTRLNVSWVLPIARRPLARSDGSYSSDVDTLFGRGGEMSRLAAALSAHATLPLTLAPAGLLLDEAADLADGYTRDGKEVEASDPAAKSAAATLAALKAAMTSGSFDLALAPYGSGDVVSLVHGDLTSDALLHLSQGRKQVTAHLGRAPNQELFVPAGLHLDARSAATVGPEGVHTVVLDPDLVPAQAGIFGPDRPVVAEGTDGTRLNALLADKPIRERLEGTGVAAPAKLDPIMLAQDAIAETASAWFERPAAAGERALVIATSTTPPAALVGALAQGLDGAPWVQMRKSTEMLAIVPAREDPQPLVLGDQGSHALVSAARSARRAIDIVRLIVEPEEATASLDRKLLAAESIEWASDPSGGIDLARAARQDAEDLIGKIQAAGYQVTLTSRTGKLPVTVQNKTGFKIRVQVVVSSAKVSFPEGDRQTIDIEGRNATITFKARALATGAFPVTVQVRTPEGELPVSENQVVVRSTAVSAVALAATGGAALFLLFAWTRRNLRKRAAAAAHTA